MNVKYNYKKREHTPSTFTCVLADLPLSMSETKIYLVQDCIIGIIYLVYYFVSKGSLEQTASSGIRGFYLMEIIFGILIQLMLAIFDYTDKKSWVASLRTGALVYVVGLLAIVVKLGLFSITFCLFFFVVLTW